jgi:hypothetical protein
VPPYASAPSVSERLALTTRGESDDFGFIAAESGVCGVSTGGAAPSILRLREPDAPAASGVSEDARERSERERASTPDRRKPGVAVEEVCG